MRIKRQNKFRSIVRGLVEHGDGSASHDYEIPTANLRLEERPDVDFGVYAVRVSFRSRTYHGALCYGVGTPPKFEVHLLDFEGDLLGEELEVEILNQVSELVDFGSKERMRQKILHDIELVQDFFRQLSE